jgi:hypothetical protein
MWCDWKQGLVKVKEKGDSCTQIETRLYYDGRTHSKWPCDFNPAAPENFSLLASPLTVKALDYIFKEPTTSGAKWPTA